MKASRYLRNIDFVIAMSLDIDISYVYQYVWSCAGPHNKLIRTVRQW